MRIAIADDDREARDFAHGVLQDAGHTCLSFGNGREIFAQLKKETFDLLVLDWNMPDVTAIEIIDWVRRNLTVIPRVIVLTSRNSDSDVVQALDAGADDFISKPASAHVIRARVAAVMRRAGDERPDPRLEHYGRYTFDRLELMAGLDGHMIKLTAKEFALAQLFFQNLQRPLSRGYIMERVWNNAVDLSTRTLDMHVSRIRSKLVLRPENGHRLQTIFGYGYRLDKFEEDGGAQG